jgi:hypothetical protein
MPFSPAVSFVTSLAINEVETQIVGAVNLSLKSTELPILDL